MTTHAVTIGQRELWEQVVTQPQPRASVLIPKKLSASGYNSLTACPYQFFAQRMLRLHALDELSDLPQKRDYGVWLHQILNIYHQALLTQPSPPDQRLQKLQEISNQRFAVELAHSAAALGYYVRWQKAMPAYLEWCEKHEQDGWHYAHGELDVEKILSFPEGSITLQGRIDRIDQNATGESSVLDYKTKTLTPLRARLKSKEDHQLAFYGLLFEPPVVDASYIALEPEREKIGAVSAPEFSQWQQQLHTQITNNLSAISQDAPLPANGINDVCEYCDMRGLCRKGMWS